MAKRFIEVLMLMIVVLTIASSQNVDAVSCDPLDVGAACQAGENSIETQEAVERASVKSNLMQVRMNKQIKSDSFSYSYSYEWYGASGRRRGVPPFVCDDDADLIPVPTTDCPWDPWSLRGCGEGVLPGEMCKYNGCSDIYDNKLTERNCGYAYVYQQRGCSSYSSSSLCPKDECVWVGSSCENSYMLTTSVCPAGYSSIKAESECSSAVPFVHASKYGTACDKYQPPGCYLHQYKEDRWGLTFYGCKNTMLLILYAGRAKNYKYTSKGGNKVLCINMAAGTALPTPSPTRVPTPSPTRPICKCMQCNGDQGKWRGGTCAAGGYGVGATCKNGTGEGCYSSLDDYACDCYYPHGQGVIS